MAEFPPKTQTNVLVIDDDTLIRIALCRLFEKMGYATSEAPNGLLGMEIFRRDNPRIVVTDLQMPGKDGFDTIADMRAADGGVKIIAMSGGAEHARSLERALELGADYTLPKPFRITDLINILNSLPPGQA